MSDVEASERFLHEDNVERIFAPLEFRTLTVKNRLFRSNLSGTFDDYCGHGTHARVNWETRFARGGVGAIISSFTPVTVRGRILTRYAMIDADDKIPFWRKVGESVHAHDCRFILQLSHSGRQQDMGGVENFYRKALSSTNRKDYFHGILAQAMTKPEIAETVEQFAQGARRAREAGLDGVELHGANGYLITQFLSSGINDRDDEYGGGWEGRARFCLEIVRAIRREVGQDFHLQMKINGVDHNDWLYPWEKKGNSLDETVNICRLLLDDGKGVDAFHVSSGSTFPHPRNPPGDLPIRELVRWYDGLLSQGVRTHLNYRIFSNPIGGPLFRRYWRWRRGKVIEGINLEYARAVTEAVRQDRRQRQGAVHRRIPARLEDRRGDPVGRLRRRVDRTAADRQPEPAADARDRRRTAGGQGMHLLQQVPDQRPREPARLLRAQPLRRRDLRGSGMTR